MMATRHAVSGNLGEKKLHLERELCKIISRVHTCN